MKNLKHYFPEFGTGCVAKVAYFNENYIDTLVEGYAQIKPCSIPMEEDFLFDIASLTKTITAILIYQAIEKNLCSLEDKVSKIDKRFLYLQKVTILDLLSHAKEIWTQGYLGTAKSKEEIYDMLFHSYIKNENPKYIDAHYMILGILLETIYQKSYREIVGENIIKPLDLTNTVFEITEKEKVVSCNYQIIGGEEIQNIDKVPHDIKAQMAYQYGFTLGHAGIFTTATDFLTILISLVDDKERLLKKSTITKMLAHNNYNIYLQKQILDYAYLYKIPMIRTNDTANLFENLLSKIVSTDFLTSIIKPYNYAGMRYPVKYKEINPIPFYKNFRCVLDIG